MRRCKIKNDSSIIHENQKPGSASCLKCSLAKRFLLGYQYSLLSGQAVCPVVKVKVYRVYSTRSNIIMLLTVLHIPFNSCKRTLGHVMNERKTSILTFTIIFETYSNFFVIFRYWEGVDLGVDLYSLPVPELISTV